MNFVMRRQPVLPVAKLPMSLASRWITGGLGLLVLLLIGVLFARIASDPLRFPINNVDVLGTLDFTDRATLQANVMAHTSNGFYSLDIDAMHRSVEAMPWVRSARVSREWPDRVSVEVEEHEPTARWNDGSLVSKRLEVFKPPQLQTDSPRFAEWQVFFSTLPHLTGADGRHESVLTAFRDYERALLAVGVEIKTLREDERRSQTLQLSNQVAVRLGYEEQELRLQRFIDVYERLVSPLGGQPVRFDMRYSNGFALFEAQGRSRDS